MQRWLDGYAFVDLRIGFLARDFMLLLAGRVMPLGAKNRLYSAYVRSAMLYGGKTWSLNEKGLFRIARNDARMVTWICNVRPESRTQG